MTRSRSYRERLLPTWWVWVVAFGFVGSLAVAYGAALGPTSGLIVFALGAGVVLWLLWITSPVIQIDDDDVEVGGARLPRRFIGSVEVVDRERIRVLRGPGADARYFVALRPWSAKGGVLITLTDADDPHPAWLFSSRHPTRAADTLTATM